MWAELLLHPHHVMPLAQFKAGRVEMGSYPVAQPLMESDACWVRVSDAGAEIADMLPAQAVFQGFIEGAANTSAMFSLSYID